MRIAVGTRSLFRFRQVLVLAVLLVLVAAAAPADAQTPLLTLDTPNPQAIGRFGVSAAVGDVNGDGKADIAVGAAESVAGNAEQGRVYVFSGADHSLLFTLDTPNPRAGACFGCTMAVGDVNGDGKADIVVTASGESVGSNAGHGRVYVFSGATGALLFTLDTPNPQANANFGGSFAVGDVNGDGKADIVVGVQQENVGSNAGQGRVYVFSGADHSLLLTLDAPIPQVDAHFGFTMAVGDVNGDGKADIAVGAAESVAGNAEQGRVYVFSGADHSLLLTLDTPNPQANAAFGAAAAVGDVNGDGKADIAVGAGGEDVGSNANVGRAHVFSEATGAPLFTLDTPNPQAGACFGCTMAVGDVNGDGEADIVVTALGESVGSNAGQGRIYVLSGATGALLFTLDTPNPQANANFGGSFAVGDVNGDGKADIVVGVQQENVGSNAGQGRAYVFSLAEAGASAGGSGWSAGAYAALAGGLGAAAIVIVGTGWYARRRWLRQRP